MSVRELIRDGRFDVVIAAGPRAFPWPSVGARAISALCADAGLKVGIFGGETVRVRGVVPLPGAGALVIAQDVQDRIHRLQARSIVRISSDGSIPDPFPGSHSQAVLPIQTALRLIRSGCDFWDPCTVILGTGNGALRLGSSLLESGVPEVLCVEPRPQWGAKRIAGWDVERRRFEMAGGKILEAVPLSLTAKASLRWELRLRDAQGVRLLEVARVISAGPFDDLPAIKEYPPGSLLFELRQTALETPAEDIEGWMLEEERGRWLGIKISRALVHDLGTKREAMDAVARRTRARLRRYLKHRDQPFSPAYAGKWLAAGDARTLREFAGVPQAASLRRKVASIECLEPIPCKLCQVACPEGAIAKGRVLSEDKCTACGLCLMACPSGTPVLLQETEDGRTRVALAWRGTRRWEAGEFGVLLNRRGEALGSARVVADGSERGMEAVPQLIEVEVPAHLLWEARGLKRPKAETAEDQDYEAALLHAGRATGKVEILLNGDKRLVRDQIPISTALFELGQGRAGDLLHCQDGSCGLCQVTVDGIKKKACQTPIHRGMVVQVPPSKRKAEQLSDAALLCSCQGVANAEVVERIRQGKLKSPEAVLSVTHVGEGKCHGQRCMDPFKRLLRDEGIDVTQWIDWRFPWSEWVLGRSQSR